MTRGCWPPPSSSVLLLWCQCTAQALCAAIRALCKLYLFACLLNSTLVVFHLNLPSNFNVAEGRRVLLDVEWTQQRVRGASEQLERANATIKYCSDKIWLECTNRTRSRRKRTHLVEGVKASFSCLLENHSGLMERKIKELAILRYCGIILIKE